MAKTESLTTGLRTTSISIAFNVALGAVKLACGIFGNSSALIADAVESLGDVASAMVVRAGIVIAAKPADTNHPYGHGKAEPLAALAVSILLLAAAAVIAVYAFAEIRLPHRTPAAYTLIVLLAVIALKESMYRYEKKASRKTRSTALLADAWHHRADALTSLAASVGISVALVGGKGYEAADDWAAIAACVVIIANGTLLANAAIHELMDAAPAQVLLDQVATIALTVEGARAIEKLLVRKAGPYYYVNIHVEVDAILTVRDGHQVAHDVKDAILAKQPGVVDVLVHIEPHEVRS